MKESITRLARNFKGSSTERTWSCCWSVASIANAPTQMSELLCIHQDPTPVTPSLWNLFQSTLMWTLSLLPWYTLCLAPSYSMFQLQVKYSFFRDISQLRQVRNLFTVLSHSPSCNCGSWNYLSSAIFSDGLWTLPELSILFTPENPVPNEEPEL